MREPGSEGQEHLLEGQVSPGMEGVIVTTEEQQPGALSSPGVRVQEGRH